MRKTISVVVENKPGVLARIVGLFSSRGYNIESLTVGETEDPSTSRMTIITSGEQVTMEQILKQLNKLIDVIKVIDMNEERCLERELALIRLSTSLKNENKLMHIINISKARVMDLTSEEYMIEVTGTDEKINAFVDLIGTFTTIREMARTGSIALSRPKKQGTGRPASNGKKVSEII
ncbi:MAG: acetolactate synthase small subunit [Oligoflexia bacterium]|nr:acetolactate synthase small subunit [Oligoflexia bacterium]